MTLVKANSQRRIEAGWLFVFQGGMSYLRCCQAS